MKVIACIEDPEVIKQILDHLRHKAQVSEPGALPESRVPPVRPQWGCLTDEAESQRFNSKGYSLPYRNALLKNLALVQTSDNLRTNMAAHSGRVLFFLPGPLAPGYLT